MIRLLIIVPRTDRHDDYMDDFDWFCYFPSRNFKGTTNPLFNYPYIGKNLWESQYGSTCTFCLPGKVDFPTRKGNFRNLPFLK